MKIEVELRTELVVEFDENSEKFKGLYENYKNYISDNDYEGFAENICNHIASYGATELIEGVGNVRINGEKQKDYMAPGAPEIDCPINVVGEFDLNERCDFEIYYTRILEEELSENKE